MYKTVEDRRYRTLLLKGSSGTGKTYKAAHFPRPVFIDFDHNLSGLRNLPEELRKEIRIVDPQVSIDKDGKATRLKGRQVYDNFINLLGKVCEDETVGTIVVDSLTTLQEFLVDKILADESPMKQMQLQNWGTLQRYWKALAEELLCNPLLDKHVIFIAHERTVEDDTSGAKVLKYGLNMMGSIREAFDLYFSDCWRLSMDYSDRAGARYIVSTQGTGMFTAKNSLGLPAQFVWEKELETILKQL